MKTNYIYNKVKAGVFTFLLSLSSFLFMGCSDFLDILPMNSTVLENYWKEKADVTGAVNGCYEALANEDVVTRMGVWGELRSENIVAGTNVPNNINEMLKENLLPSNDLCQWGKVYNVINRCNIVCHYAHIRGALPRSSIPISKRYHRHRCRMFSIPLRRPRSHQDR